MKKIAGMLLVVLAVAGVLWADSALSITGAGATFPYPMYSKWFDEYHKKNANLEINYQSIGSGGGIKQVTLGADVPAYNIPGMTAELHFTQDAIAGIFLGKITKWNDPAISGPNKGVNLPTNDIVVVHRSEGSGTTYIWTDYLSKVSEEWKTKVGKGASVNWPVGLGAKGNESVAGTIKNTPNSFGYVELIYAIQNNMPYGRVRNSSGAFIKADLASVTAAAAGAAKNMPDDFRVSITDAPGKTAYPISSFTWLLVPAKFSDATKRDAIKGFVKWMLADGQNYTEALSYAKLPKEVVAKELKALNNVQ